MPEWVVTGLRSAGVFALTLLGVRLLGKRTISRLTLFDLVIVVAIGTLAAVLSLNPPGLVDGVIPLVVWIALPVTIYFLSLKFKTVRDIYQGKETVLINHGKVLDEKLRETRLASEDLLGMLREKDVFNFADVEFAVLEPTGDVSVLLKKNQQSVTPKTLGMTVAEESVPQTVVLDGNIMDEALTAMGLNRGWLATELDKAGVALENVFIAQVDSTGQIYLDLFDDSIQIPKPTTRKLSLATLRKCQADCELYALGTRDEAAKAMYQEAAEAIQNIADDLKPLLQN